MYYKQSSSLLDLQVLLCVFVCCELERVSAIPQFLSLPLPFQRSSDSNYLLLDDLYQSSGLGEPVHLAPRAVMTLRFFLIQSSILAWRWTQLLSPLQWTVSVHIYVPLS